MNITLTPTNRLASEVVWNDSPLAFGAGGGGTSAIFGRPSWQTGPGTTPGARDVPDVSMLADQAPGYAIYCTLACAMAPPTQVPGWRAVGGTSAAAPLLAAGIADADQAAAAHRQPPLGFVNPLLYRSRREVTRDITTGNNDLGQLINQRPPSCCTAHNGYDLASGLGSVNLDALARAASKAYRR